MSVAQQPNFLPALIRLIPLDSKVEEMDKAAQVLTELPDNQRTTFVDNILHLQKYVGQKRGLYDSTRSNLQVSFRKDLDSIISALSGVGPNQWTSAVLAGIAASKNQVKSNKGKTKTQKRLYKTQERLDNVLEAINKKHRTVS